MDNKELLRINSVDIEHVYGRDTYAPIRATISCDMKPSVLEGCKSFRDISEKIKKMFSNSADYIPKRILKSGPCTIVFWNDGTKTMVRRAMDEETDSPYDAFTAALAIKIFGSNSAVKRIVKNNLVDQIKKTKKTKKTKNNT